MRSKNGTITLAPTDLSNYLSCRHASGLDLSAVQADQKRPARFGPYIDLLRQRGIAHERAYLGHLRGQGLNVVAKDDPENPGEFGVIGSEERDAAMNAGADVIYQPRLGDEAWSGLADFLIKVDRPSALGDWSYEVTDTKLARDTRAGTILQLCVYTRLLETLQGERPKHMHVVTPGNDFAPLSYRTDDYSAYFRLIEQGLEQFVQAPAQTYPEKVPFCDLCAWWEQCEQRRRSDDHLCYVAGISKGQIESLRGIGVNRLEDLATLEDVPPPDRGSHEALIRIRDQARAQNVGRQQDEPFHQLREPFDDKHGFVLLPVPTPDDIFLDFEGNHFTDDGVQEYLTGYVTLDAHGNEHYTPIWARTLQEERQAFEQFMDVATATRARNPNAHIYHFAAYEPVALKRLMGRYASKETELDALLRGRAFIDLHTVVRRALIAGVEQYSIKDLEPFFGYERAQDLRAASMARRLIEQAMEAGDSAESWAPLKQAVEDYNREDCESTRRLRDWLETLRAGVEAKGEKLARPFVGDGEASEELSDLDRELQRLRDGLLQGVPLEPDQRSPEQQARFALAHMMEFHRREDKASWWEYFRLLDLSPEEYPNERRAITGLMFLEEIERGKAPVHRYRFAEQDVDVRRRDNAHVSEEIRLGTIVDVNYGERTVDIKKMKVTAGEHPSDVVLHSNVDPKPLRESLMRYGDVVLERGFSGTAPYTTADALMLKRPPALAAGESSLQHAGETVVNAACRMALTLDGQVLAVQGPPGTGKTYTGAHLICALKQQGLKVGVTAVSHKVITNLLEGAMKEAQKMGLALNAVHKTDKAYQGSWGIETARSYPPVLKGLRDGSIDVVGATAFGWAQKDFEGKVDVLIVDEAGQMALSNTLAAAPGGRSMVLLGDPQQLEQPLQSSHPEGSEVSVLYHWLGGADTMPAHLGLFLDETYRLHPDIATFTSEVYYEGKLSARPELAKQEVRSGTSEIADLVGSGLRYVPVVHSGNQAKSREEVEAIRALVAQLLRDSRWRDKDGVERALTMNDILIVAPYNAQVAALTEALPDLADRIGTVDRFQGQEAPVVIYSMTSSSPEDAPRGMEFLYNGHRFNVATSRAKALCVLVGNPSLFEPECRTPRQMKMANGFCRYLELATIVQG